MKVFISALSVLFLTLTITASFSSSAHAVMPGTMKGTSPTYSSGNAGKAKCPAGTCSKVGTSWAQDVRYCSAANCKK